MKKILVIEDETPVRQNLVELLTLEGYQAIEAGDGEEGVQRAWETLPDLILCDITMPKMDGYAVLSRVSNDPRTAAIPFIFLTARTEREDLRRGMNLGADDFITKPFSIDEVLGAIETRLQKYTFLENQAQEKLAETGKSIRLSLPGEMLSPLSVIISSSELLSNRQDMSRLDSAQINALGQEIHRAAGILLRSIQNYMFISELEAIKGDPARMRALRESRLFSASMVISEIAQLKAQQETREDDLHIQLEDSPLGISEMYAQRIMEELLDYVFRNSPPGSPVDLIGEVQAGQRRYLLQVRSNGKSMPFELAAELSGSSQSRAGIFEQAGQEVGLIIVKRLIDLHQGSLRIQSQPGQGTLFQIHIPLSS
jgi:CheY-like chemotaxis protein